MQYLDGLRGLAAVQVLLLHYGNTFLPETVGPGILRYVTDGASAVYLFFVLSGFVLTFAFSREPREFTIGVIGRIARLWPPCAAAALASGALVFTYPDYITQASAVAGSPWAGNHYTGKNTLVSTALDTTGLTTLFGFSGTSIFGVARSFLPHHTASTNQPLWSLHIELWGSFLVLALVYARATSRWVYGGAVAASGIMIGAHPLGLFVAGHLLAILFARPIFAAFLIRHSAMVSAAGLCLLTAGILICGYAEVPGVRWLGRVLLLGSVVPVHIFFSWHDEMGALLIFSGVLLTGPLQVILQSRLAVYLGRLSFSVYLLHWPIMLTAGSYIFLRTEPHVGQEVAAFLALALGSVLTFGSAELFERYIDAPVVALSRRLRKAAIAKRRVLLSA